MSAELKTPATLVTRIERTRVMRINKVLNDDKLSYVEEAVLRSHKIFTLASQLLKLYFVDEFELSLKLCSNKKEAFKRFSNKQHLTADIFLNALTVVSSNQAKKVGRPFKSDSSAGALYKLYDQYKGEC